MGTSLSHRPTDVRPANVASGQCKEPGELESGGVRSKVHPGQSKSPDTQGEGLSLHLGQILCKTFSMSKCQSLAFESSQVSWACLQLCPWVSLVNGALHPFLLPNVRPLTYLPT